jgi:hypothetical protein
MIFSGRPRPANIALLALGRLQRASACAQVLCTLSIVVVMGSVPGAIARALERRGREEGVQADGQGHETQKVHAALGADKRALSLTLCFFSLSLAALHNFWTYKNATAKIPVLVSLTLRARSCFGTGTNSSRKRSHTRS